MPVRVIRDLVSNPLAFARAVDDDMCFITGEPSTLTRVKTYAPHAVMVVVTLVVLYLMATLV